MLWFEVSCESRILTFLAITFKTSSQWPFTFSLRIRSRFGDGTFLTAFLRPEFLFELSNWVPSRSDESLRRRSSLCSDWADICWLKSVSESIVLSDIKLDHSRFKCFENPLSLAYRRCQSVLPSLRLFSSFASGSGPCQCFSYFVRFREIRGGLLFAF